MTLVIVSLLGHLQVVIIPCKKDGTELTDDYVDDPEELVSQRDILTSLPYKISNPKMRELSRF